MLRKLLAVVVTAAALLAFAPPAQAEAPRSRGPVVSVYPLPLCVTTSWRAAYTHQPKTRPGATCLLTAGMWLPRSWVVLGSWRSSERWAGRFLSGLVVWRPPVASGTVG